MLLSGAWCVTHDGSHSGGTLCTASTARAKLIDARRTDAPVGPVLIRKGKAVRMV